MRKTACGLDVYSDDDEEEHLDECDECAGAAEATRAIVADLRAYARVFGGDAAQLLNESADRYERGEHLKGGE